MQLKYRMKKLCVLLLLFSFFSCKKTEGKINKSVEQKSEQVLDTLPKKELKKTENFAISISDATTKQLIETFKNDGIVSFYFIVENNTDKAETQQKTLMELVKFIREAKYNYGINISRNNMYRKMTIEITYNDKNKTNLQTYFSKIKEILNKVHVKGVQVESE